MFCSLSNITGPDNEHPSKRFQFDFLHVHGTAVDFKATALNGQGTLSTSRIQDVNREQIIPAVSGVDILGFHCPNTEVLSFPGSVINVSIRVNGKPHPTLSVAYDLEKGALHIEAISAALEEGVSIEWDCHSAYPTT